MARNSNDYSNELTSEENINRRGKYSVTGESEFSRENTIPFDEDEILSERHYALSPLEIHGRRYFRSREPESESTRRPDAAIKSDVLEALYQNTQVDASFIEVNVEGAIVILKGSVTDEHQQTQAYFTADSIPGVRRVLSELKVVKSKNGPFGLTNNITGMN
jgi:hypothetical protein